MRFELNTIGKISISRQTKELWRFLWGGFLLLALFIVGIRYGMGNQTFMYIVTSILYLVFFVFIPINLRIKIYKVIHSIDFTDANITFETKKGIFSSDGFKIVNAKGGISGFGRNHTNGYILKDISDGKEYWLIESFFNEIEEIKDALARHI